MEEKVERLQKNLYLIRASAGWSASELGKKLGVSRQMISNLESGRNKMTVMQYHAIRNVINDEIESCEEEDTAMMRALLFALVDEPERFSPEEYNKVLSDANLLVPSIIQKKTSRRKAAGVWFSALAGKLVSAAMAAFNAAKKVLKES